MPRLSCAWIVVLVIIFTMFLLRAYLEDVEMAERYARDKLNYDISTEEGFRAAVHHEIEHGIAKSKVKTLLTNSRDQIIRGALMGAIGGGAIDALHNAVTWSLVGGIVSGCSDWMKWSK